MIFRNRVVLAFLALSVLCSAGYAILVWWIYIADSGITKNPVISKVSIQHLRGPIHAIAGLGGNITVSIGPDGLLLVDTGEIGIEEQVLKAVSELTDRPAVYVITTHSHGDHRGNNWVFRRQGAEIIAHSWAAEAIRLDGYAKAREDDIPTIVFDDSMSLNFNGEVITIQHLPDGHTQGDIIVHFHGSNVLATGDIFVNQGLPFISLGSKVTLAGHIAAQAQLIERIDANTIVVGGHGALATRADLRKTSQILDRINTKIIWLKSLGISKRYLPLFHPNQGWPSDWRDIGVTDKKFCRMVWQGIE